MPGSVRDVGVNRGGLVTIACLPTAAFYFLPTVIRQFNEEHPNIRFRILDLPATDGLQAVARGEVEFGINIMGTSDPDLTFDRLVEDPFVLAARKDHPLAEKAEVGWADLEPYHLITVHRSSANRTLLDAALAKSSIKLRWFYEVTHLSTSLGLVEAGLGISVLPQMATPQGEHPFLISRPIRNPAISRTIGVVRRRGGTLSPAAEQFLNMLIGTWSERETFLICAAMSHNGLCGCRPGCKKFLNLFEHVIVSGLMEAACLAPRAGMVISGSGPNLNCEHAGSETLAGFPDPDLFDRSAHSGDCLLTLLDR